MVVGLTGGIGTGKSAVTDILHDKYNAHLLIADDVAKSLMKKGMKCYNDVVDYFGTEILSSETGEIDRVKLSAIVFNDSEKLLKLNSLVHPAVHEHILNAINYIKKDVPDALIVVETAVLIEAHFNDFCDEIWTVISSKEDRINRLMTKRGYSLEKCESIMDDQMSDEEFINISDFVIYNMGTKEDLALEIAGHMDKCGKY